MRLPTFYVVVFSAGLLSVILSAILVYFNVFYLDKVGKSSIPAVVSDTHNFSSQPINTPTAAARVNKFLEVKELVNLSQNENEAVYLSRNVEGKTTVVGYRGYVRSLDSATKSIQIYWPVDSTSSYTIRVPTDTVFLFGGQDTVALMKSAQGDITKIDSQLSFGDIRPGDFIQLSLMDKNTLFVHRKKI